MTAITPPVERVEVRWTYSSACPEFADNDVLEPYGFTIMVHATSPVLSTVEDAYAWAKDRIATAQASAAEIARLEKEHYKTCTEWRSQFDWMHGRAMRAEAESARLREEREFLLLRSLHAGSAYFGSKRWTGMSSNALVEVAFGGKNDRKPRDGGDLAACYRTVKRLPKHLLTDAVFDQLEAGERCVGSWYPEGLAWARIDAEWPDDARSVLAGGSKQEVVDRG